MCSQVSWVNVTYVPACAAFSPAIRAVIFSPPPLSSPIKTPHTSVLLFERACCRICRSTSPSIVTRDCCSDLRFPMNRSARQLRPDHRVAVSANQVRFFCVAGAHTEYVEERQANLIQRASAEALAAIVVVDCLHHSHLPVFWTTPFGVANASHGSKLLLARAAQRAFQFMHDIPAELHHNVARAQVGCTTLTQVFKRQLTRFLRQPHNIRERKVAHAVRVRRVLHLVRSVVQPFKHEPAAR